MKSVNKLNQNKFTKEQVGKCIAPEENECSYGSYNCLTCNNFMTTKNDLEKVISNIEKSIHSDTNTMEYQKYIGTNGQLNIFHFLMEYTSGLRAGEVLALEHDTKEITLK